MAKNSNGDGNGELVVQSASGNAVQSFNQLPARELKVLRYQCFYAAAVLYLGALYAVHLVFGSFTNMGLASLLGLPAVPLAAFALIFGPVAFARGKKRGNRTEMLAASTSLVFWVMALLFLLSMVLNSSLIGYAAATSTYIWMATTVVSFVASIKVVKDLRKQIAHRDIKLLGCHKSH